MTKDNPKKPKKITTHKTHKKVFDVVRPGKAPASPTSRPVIASQKPPVADDQFVPGAPALRASDPFAKHDLLDGKNKKALNPLGSPDTETSVKSEPDVVPASPVAPTTPDAPVTSVAPGGAPSLPAAAVSPAPTAVNTPTAENSAPETPDAPATSQDIPPTPEAPATPAADLPATPGTSVAQATTPSPASAPLPEEETPAHLALEQTVQTDVPIWEHPETSTQVEIGTSSPSQRQGSSKSIEDLLAETGAPLLENEQTPSLIVSHHNPRSRAWKVFLVFVIVLILAVAVIDLLLDAGVIKTGADVPYTDFL